MRSAGIGCYELLPRLWMPGGTALPCSAVGFRALAQTIECKIHALLLLHAHSRCPHGISTPTACLPASQPASQPLPCPPLPPKSGMPCATTACEPRSICVVPCTPPYSLCTCMYASVPNHVARNRHPRFIVRAFSLLVLYLLLRTTSSVPAFVLP